MALNPITTAKPATPTDPSPIKGGLGAQGSASPFSFAFGSLLTNFGTRSMMDASSIIPAAKVPDLPQSPAPAQSATSDPSASTPAQTPVSNNRQDDASNSNSGTKTASTASSNTDSSSNTTDQASTQQDTSTSSQGGHDNGQAATTKSTDDNKSAASKSAADDQAVKDSLAGSAQVLPVQASHVAKDAVALHRDAKTANEQVATVTPAQQSVQTGKDPQQAAAAASIKGQSKRPTEDAQRGLDRADVKANSKAAVHTLNTPAKETVQTADPSTVRQQQQDDLAKHLKSDQPTKVTVAVQTKADPATPQTTAATAVQSAVTDADAKFAAAQKSLRNAKPAQDPQAAQPVASQAATAPNPATQGQGMFAQQAAALQAASEAAKAEVAQTAPQTAPQSVSAVTDVQAAGPAAPSSGPQLANAARQPAQAAAPQRPAPLPQSTINQISVNIAKAAANGADSISIKLHPAELGRIDVQLHVNHNGHTTVTVTADHPDTLHMLRHDARGLEKALQNAGLNTGGGDLNFNLRGENQQQQADQSGNGGSFGASSSSAQPTESLEEQLQALNTPAYTGNTAANGRIDIRA